MERYEIGKDFNTKDWFVYDNKTDMNICRCDTKEEAEQFVKTMEDLQNIIEENIEWFWENDTSIWCDDGGVFKDEPTIITEFNVKEIWGCFKTWCIQNCVENFNGLSKFFIESEVDNSYCNWLYCTKSKQNFC